MNQRLLEHNGAEKALVVGLGQACVDYLGVIPFYPQEDGKMEIMDFHMKCGGPASTAMVTLARLGISCSFMGSVSDDIFGQKIRQNLMDQNVDISHLKITPGYTSQFAFICISQKTGKRTIFWHRGNVPHLTSLDVHLIDFPAAKILHIDGLMVDACIESARQAKQLGMTVVMDAGTMREGSKEIVSFVDILIASETFADPIVEKNATVEQKLEALVKMGPKEVVITLGEKGSVGVDQNGQVHFQKAFQVNPVDTTGAGDVYHGAYIHGLLTGKSMPQCMRFASAVAAINCTRIGAQGGIPTLRQVENFLSKAK